MGVVPLTVIPSDSLAIFLFPVPISLCSTGPEGLVPKGAMLLPGDIIIKLNCKLRIPPSHFGLLMTLNQQAKQGFMCWLG